MNGRFLINRGDAKLMGVAAGLADYTGIDPTIIRLGFVAATLLTGPVMILMYVLAGLLSHPFGGAAGSVRARRRHPIRMAADRPPATPPGPPRPRERSVR